MVVLPSQSVQTVIVILGEQGSALADGFEIARLVIGVTERGGIGVCTVDMACHACHNLGLDGFAVLGRIQIAVSVAEQCSAADGEGTAIGPAESVLGYLIGELAVKGNAHHFVVGVDMTAGGGFINRAVGLPDRAVSLRGESFVGVIHKSVGCQSCATRRIGLHNFYHIAFAVICVTLYKLVYCFLFTCIYIFKNK